MFSKSIKSLCIIMAIFILCSICMPLKVNANSISPYSYFDPNSFSFKGSFRGNVQHHDGNYMAFEAKATSSDGVSREVIISVYIASRNTTEQYKIYTDGVNRKFDYIPIGGSSDVVFYGSCSNSSVTINLDLKMYSWS